MTNEHQLLESLFLEARRNVFVISFFYFIGGIAGLGVLTVLDPELGIIILVLGCVWMISITVVFLLLIRRIHQPLAEIKEITNEFFAGIMEDEELEPTGTGPEAEKQSMTQHLKEMRKEISILREKEQTPAVVLPRFPSIRWFDWRVVLVLKWVTCIVFILGLAFTIPDVFNVYFAVAGVVGVTVIALAYARMIYAQKKADVVREKEEK